TSLRRELQAPRHLLGQHCARILMVALVAGLTGVMKEKGQIQDGGILQFLKQGAVATEFLGLRKKDAVEFLDAHQSVLVGRVAMVKFVLDQARECAELRNIASEKAEVVHFAKDAADLALARKDRQERLSGDAGILKCPVPQTQAPANAVPQLGAESELPDLGVMKSSDESVGVFGESFLRFLVELSVTGHKSVKFLDFRAKNSEERGPFGDGAYALDRCLRNQMDVARVA